MANRVEWRVLRGDGRPCPLIGPMTDENAARFTLKHRQENGKNHPYKLQRREMGPWQDVDTDSHEQAPPPKDRVST